MTLDPFARRARLIILGATNPLHDADTVKLETDSGYDGRQEPWLRLDFTYMPELKDPGGPEMRQVLVDWFDAADYTLVWPFWVVSTKTKVREPGQRQTFVRYLAQVWYFNGSDIYGPSINEVVNAELAKHPEWGPGNT